MCEFEENEPSDPFKNCLTVKSNQLRDLTKLKDVGTQKHYKRYGGKHCIYLAVDVKLHLATV